jgi:UDP-N-acetylglucosamine 2-epimerase (non-hydrolysing)
MKRVMMVFGTRPEAIKMAPLVKAFQRTPDYFETLVCVTGQHREMLDQVLRLFEIVPDYDLNIMKNGQDLYDITSRVLTGMGELLKSAKPDIVIVHGDTTTSMASALAAFYQKIPVGHVEAGLRTHNVYSPWPEEMNRQITGRIAAWHFAPTEVSKQNLFNEGVREDRIFVTGNTVIDALHWVIEKIKNAPEHKAIIEEHLSSEGIGAAICKAWLNNDRKMVLITGHRRENFGQGFINICEAIKDLSDSFPLVDFVYPMHLNPNVRNAIHTVFGDTHNVHPGMNNKNVYFIEPLDYLPFIYLMNLSHLVLTDSGGIQEEAPGLGKPVLVMRDTTERPEALEAGTVKLVGTDKSVIKGKVSELICNSVAYNVMSTAANPYGDGLACKRIAEALFMITRQRDGF